MSKTEDNALLKELREEFLESARVDLEDWEGDLLDYESGDEEKLKDLMRLIHSMKGSSQAIGLIDLGACLHDLENWIPATLESKGRSVVVSTGLAYVDQLRVYCSVVTKGQDGGLVIQALRKLLL